MSEKSVLTKKSQKKKLICVSIYVWVYDLCFFFFMIEKSVLTKKIKKRKIKKKKSWFLFMFGFVICVSDFVDVISGCKIDFFFFFLMIESYWATAFD